MPTSSRFVEAGPDDPDRQMALKITNYVGNMPLKQVVAVYALAIGMSFRNMGFALQTDVLWAIVKSCRASWAQEGAETERPCAACLGAGTVKQDGSPIRHEQVVPEDQVQCPGCRGLGRTEAL